MILDIILQAGPGLRGGAGGGGARHAALVTHDHVPGEGAAWTRESEAAADLGTVAACEAGEQPALQRLLVNVRREVLRVPPPVSTFGYLIAPGKQHYNLSLCRKNI